MTKKLLITATLLILGLVVFLLAGGNPGLSNDGLEKKILTLNSTEYTLDVADATATRIMGLSGRDELPAKTGMLFVFEKPDFHGIWMKDMNFDIDIVWLDSNKRVVHITPGATPGSYPTVFYPRTQSMYVIELNSGVVGLEGIETGGILEF